MLRYDYPEKDSKEDDVVIRIQETEFKWPLRQKKDKNEKKDKVPPKKVADEPI